MDKFTFYGFSEFVVSVNYKADMIKLYFSDPEVRANYEEVTYIKEEKPLGTIGSLNLAKDVITDSFFITNADILVEEDLDKIMRFHKDNKTVLTVVGCLKNSVVPYGVLNMDQGGLLVNIEEKPQYKHIINTGVYVAEPEIMSFINADERKDINQLIEDILKSGKPIGVYPVLEEQWFDIGQ